MGLDSIKLNCNHSDDCDREGEIEISRKTAQQLFAVLREFDAQGAKLSWVEEPPPEAAWDGVRDRLQRAAAS